jgi:carboxylesterase type B
LDATRVGPSCYQSKTLFGMETQFPFLPNKDISEDCLHLHIYVPHSIATERARAVMVWIHGGAFLLGQASHYDGSRLALRGDVIVVSVNYRLGPFGFLSTGDSASPGNYGLWDQRLAIQWTKDNIASFGGDPESITIFGESAGGMSIGLQSISPVNKGLFQRSIAHSATAFSAVAIGHESDYKLLAFGLAKELNCIEQTDTTPDTKAFIQCLQSKSASDIQIASEPLMGEVMSHLVMPVAPVVDNDFLPALPDKLLMDSNSKSNEVFSDIDFMAGSTNDDGAAYSNLLQGVADALHINYSLGMPASALCDHVAPITAKYFYGTTSSEQVSAALCSHYTVSSGDQIEQSQRVLDMFGDILFHGPAVRQLQLHGKATHSRATFQYLFSHRPDLPMFWTFAIERPTWLKGANHGDDLAFVFGLKDIYLKKLTFSAKELKLADQVMDYWANFAKHG